MFPVNDVRKIYNLLSIGRDGVSLSIIPETSHPARLLVLNCSTSIPVESLTARVLGHALSELTIATDQVRRFLQKNEGDDHWAMNTAD